MNSVNSTLIAVFAALLSLHSQAAAGVEQKKTQVANLVRALGYGGAIHNFKNYVLRGDARCRAEVERSITQAEEIVSALRKEKELTEQEHAALNGIAMVIGKYRAALSVVAKLRGDGRNVREIDQAVKIDDGPALAGIETLRKGHTWSRREQLEYLLGYGGAIHSFKNYVLRGDKKIQEATDKGLTQLEGLVAELRTEEGLSKGDLAALDSVEQVVKAYHGALPVVMKLTGEGKDARSIDAAVKVNDAPALAGLGAFRKK